VRSRAANTSPIPWSPSSIPVPPAVPRGRGRSVLSQAGAVCAPILRGPARSSPTRSTGAEGRHATPAPNSRLDGALGAEEGPPAAQGITRDKPLAARRWRACFARFASVTNRTARSSRSDDYERSGSSRSRDARSPARTALSSSPVRPAGGCALPRHQPGVTNTERATAADEDQERGSRVLDLDECECRAGQSCAPADAGVSSL
jgi:hypothetical protein